MLEWLERKTKSAYLKSLEAEVARLRDENRQLVNSILSSHGMPGIDPQRSTKEMQPLKRPNWVDFKRKRERQAAMPPPVAVAGRTIEPVNQAPDDTREQ